MEIVEKNRRRKIFFYKTSAVLSGLGILTFAMKDRLGLLPIDPLVVSMGLFVLTGLSFWFSNRVDITL